MFIKSNELHVYYNIEENDIIIMKKIMKKIKYIKKNLFTLTLIQTQI